MLTNAATLTEDPISHERFTIVRRIGAGGMGVVFEAFDRARGVPVALKTLQTVDPTSLLAFKQEFRALSAIAHENLVPLYELFSDGERWFFTMELVEGAVDLATWVHGSSGGERDASGTEMASAETLAVSGEISRPVGVSWDATPELASAATISSLPPVSGVEATVVAGAFSPERASATDATLELSRGEASLRADPSEATDRTLVAPSFTLRSAPVEAARVTSSPSVAARLPTPVGDFVKLRRAFVQLAEAVSAIHRAGKLHRDLKPGNVLVGRDGRVRVLDFGLIVELGDKKRARPDVGDGQSSRPSASTSASDVGGIAGTVGYMAPEQAAAEALGPPSDWYAVGAILFFALTGRLPFEGSVSEVLRAKILQRAPAPQALVDGLPSDLARLASDLLARDPAARPTAAEVLARLRVGLGEEAHVGKPTSSIDAALTGEVPLVGRERELATLLDAARGARDGTTTVLRVAGRSGAGKSALVETFLEQALGDASWLVLEGRCYEQESLPYKAIDGVLDAATAYLAGLSSPTRAVLLPDGLEALPVVFPALARLPELASAKAPELDRKTLRERAFGELASLLAALAAERPLVVYVDDLQWGDADSADLLGALLAHEGLGRVLFLFASRSELAERSECLRAVEGHRATTEPRVRWVDVAVEALDEGASRRLAETLLARGPRGHSTPETLDWIVRQSGGSALFVYELARHALTHEVGDRALAAGDLDGILRARVAALPGLARSLVEVLALAGQPLALRHVEVALGEGALPPQVIKQTRLERLVRGAGFGHDDEIETFHDRVRESVAASLSPERKLALHRGLARALDGASGVPPELVATHLEAAGDGARAAVHYRAAADAALAVLAFERAEHLFDKVLALTNDRELRADVYEKLAHFYTDLARFPEAYEIGRKGAALFGGSLPAKFVPPRLIASIVGVEVRLVGKDVASLAALPETRDEDSIRIARFIAACAKAAYQIRPELCVNVSAQLVGLCLSRGITRDAAVGFMVYGAIFKGGVVGRHAVGHAWGKLALALVDRFANEAQRAEVSFVVGYFGTSWLEPAVNAEALFATAFESGLATRDYFHVGCATAGTLVGMSMRGAPLAEIDERAGRYLEVLGRLSLEEPILCARFARHVARTLQGEPTDAEFFASDAYREALSRFGSRHFVQHHHVGAAKLAWLVGDHAGALAAVEASAGYLADSPGMLHAAEHHFWAGMTHASLAEGARGSARSRHAREVAKAAKRFAGWARQCPANFEHKALVLAGEVAALRGRAAEAATLRAKASAAAREHGYLDVEGIAAERAGDRAAARDAYARWGATALVSRLDRA